MKLKRLFGTAFVLSSVLAGLVAFSPRAAHGTDLRDSATLVAHPAADINDVYMFPSPSNTQNNTNNVVLVMTVNPALSTNASSASFDSSVLYQFKIAHSASPWTTSSVSSAAATEDTVIQFLPASNGTGQSITMFGPAAPNITGTTSTVLSTSTSSGNSVSFGKSKSFSVMGYGTGNTATPYTVSVYAGLLSDPSFFDLTRFYALFPDRNPSNWTATPLPTSTSAATGFAQTPCDMSSTPNNYFSGLKTLAIVVEMPKALLMQVPGASATQNYVHVWATTSTISGS